jgi:cytochrome c5
MKKNSAFLAVLLCLLALSGCSGSKPEPEQKPDLARGGRVFDVFCASCHLNANNDNDAPQLDEADDWDLRNSEWTAILKDHAKNGFLGMPAKGGHSKLSDQNISDALYYMEVKIKALQ